MAGTTKKIYQWNPDVMFKYVDGVHDELLTHIKAITPGGGLLSEDAQKYYEEEYKKRYEVKYSASVTVSATPSSIDAVSGTSDSVKFTAKLSASKSSVAGGTSASTIEDVTAPSGWVKVKDNEYAKTVTVDKTKASVSVSDVFTVTADGKEFKVTASKSVSIAKPILIWNSAEHDYTAAMFDSEYSTFGRGKVGDNEWTPADTEYVYIGSTDELKITQLGLNYADYAGEFATAIGKYHVYRSTTTANGLDQTITIQKA